MKIKTNIRAGQGGSTDSVDSSTSSSTDTSGQTQNQKGKTTTTTTYYTRCAGY